MNVCSGTFDVANPMASVNVHLPLLPHVGVGRLGIKWNWEWRNTSHH